MRRNLPDGGEHVVKDGEWFQKIALCYGYHEWQALWDHADNASLRKVRKYPELLVPGDKVVIPPREKGSADCASEKRHRFKLKPAMDALVVRLLDEDDQPLANLSYELRVDSDIEFVQEGKKTTGEGILEEKIHRSATKATLKLLGRDTVVCLDIGYLRPIDSKVEVEPVVESAVRQRLSNLQFGGENSELGEGIKRFTNYCDEHQDDLGYTAGAPTTEVTPKVRQALAKMHEFDDSA